MFVISDIPSHLPSHHHQHLKIKATVITLPNRLFLLVCQQSNRLPEHIRLEKQGWRSKAVEKQARAGLLFAGDDLH